MTGYILRHEAHFRAVMEEQLRLESSEQIRIRRKRLERNENRIAELKRLFIRIYEDNACGRLSDERFDMLSLTYETEQKQLETECVTLRQEIEVQERQNENVEKFIQTAHKYVGIDKLDGYALRELVSAIYVDAPDKSSGKRVQHIHIQYDGLGFILSLIHISEANDVTIMKEGHPETGTPLFWWVRLELNQRCFRCHGFTDRCDRQLRALTHMAESAELESDITSDTIRLAGGPRAFRVHSPNMAGVAGLEPTNAGVRDRCLDHLATPQYIGRDRATRTPTGGFGDRCSSG